MKSKFLYSIMAISLLITGNCKEKTPEPNGMHGTITFIRGNVTLNEQKTNVGKKVYGKDTLETKAASSTIVQFSENAIITMKSNTIISIEKLLKGDDGKPAININQNQGSTFNKIIPGKAKYKISTPTITAGVRGTSFSVQMSNGKKSTIKLLRGSVAVSKPVAKEEAEEVPETEKKEEPAEEIILKAGDKIEVTEVEVPIPEPEKMEEHEIEELSKLNQIAFVPEPKLDEIETISEKEPEKLEKVIEEMKEVVPEEIEEIIMDKPADSTQKMEDTQETQKKEPKKMTLDDLRNKYGKLSEIKTKDGRTFIGSFKQVGASMEIQTLKGKEVINVSQIEKISPYDN